jgi:hypothetical protein
MLDFSRLVTMPLTCETKYLPLKYRCSAFERSGLPAIGGFEKTVWLGDEVTRKMIGQYECELMREGLGVRSHGLKSDKK